MAQCCAFISMMQGSGVPPQGNSWHALTYLSSHTQKVPTQSSENCRKYHCPVFHLNGDLVAFTAVIACEQSRITLMNVTGRPSGSLIAQIVLIVFWTLFWAMS